MAVSDVSRINGFSTEPGRASGRVLGTIKQKASAHPNNMTQRTVKASGVASNSTKGFARKSYTLQLSAAAVRKGPYYAKPQ